MREKSGHQGRRRKRSLIAEGAVIVASILLAFAIDAAWDEYQERERAAFLGRALLSDVEETQKAIDERAAWAAEVVARARTALTGMGKPLAAAEANAIVSDVGNVFVKGYWAPINHTYEQALGGGNLALVAEADLRLLLGRYAEALRRFGDLQDSVITQYYAQLEPFMVAHTNYAEVAWSGEAGGLVAVPFQTNAEELLQSREFANLLNLKLELELEVISALEELQDLSGRLAQRLRNHMP